MKGHVRTEQISLPFAFAEATRRNLILEAGAGTGKTTSIVRELLSILITEPSLNAERVVLVTFTEKAAGELSERVRQAISCLYETALEGKPRWPRLAPIFEPAVSPVVLEACSKHFDQIDRFQAQTIHSFCQRLLRLHPLEAGVNPQFAIVEGYERARLYESIYGQWLHEETTQGAPETFQDWETALTHLSRLDRIREVILGILPKRDLILDDSYELGGIEDADETIRLILGDIRSAGADRLKAITDQTVRTFITYIRQNPDPGDVGVQGWIDFFSPVLDVLSEVHLARVKSFKTNFKFLRGEKGTIVDRLRNHLAAVAVRRLATRFISRLDQEKALRGVLDFDDLLFRAAAVLRDERVLSEVRQRYDYFFIDEFQDTDRTQAEIIDKLSRDAGGMLIPGRTTIVGDPKQSIYSFRRADPETYQEFVRRFVAEGAEKRVLTDQYRSDPALVGSLNVMFSQLFSADSSGDVARPSYEPLTPRKPSGTSLDSRITFLRSDDTDEHEATDARQAVAVANWIRSTANERDWSYRRFAVLLRKMTNVDMYLETLDRYGIPYVLPPTRAFLSRPAIVDVMAVLRAIAHPFDEAAVISAARTPYYALSDDEIVRAGLLGQSNVERFEDMKKTLDRYASLAPHLPTASLIDQLIEDSDVRTLYGALAGGERSLLHLSAFRDLSAEFDLATGDSLTQFIDELYRRREESDEAEPTWLEDSDAVAVMTVHASKGLEFDTVILPDLSSRMRQEDVRVFAVDEPRSLVLSGRLSPLAAEFRVTPGGQPLSKIAEERLDAEIDRLFYVAVTRAREEVVFVTDRGDQSSAFWKSLQRVFGFDSKGVGHYFQPDAPRVRREVGVGFEKIEVTFQVEKSEEDDAREVMRFVHPAIAAAFDSEAGQASDPPVLNDVEGPACRTSDSHSVEANAEVTILDRKTIARRRASARNRNSGILLHRILELWDGSDRSLNALLDSLAVEQQVSGRTKDAVRQRLATFRSSPHLKRILDAETVGRELPISYRDAAGNPAEGRIDRLIRENGEFVVVDYKGGKKDDERLQSDREQVRRYCTAIATMTGTPCRGLLWYVDLEEDELVEVSFLFPSPEGEGAER